MTRKFVKRSIFFLVPKPCENTRSEPAQRENMGTSFCGVLSNVRAGGHDFQFAEVKMVVPENSAEKVPLYGYKRWNRGV